MISIPYIGILTCTIVIYRRTADFAISILWAQIFVIAANAVKYLILLVYRVFFVFHNQLSLQTGGRQDEYRKSFIVPLQVLVAAYRAKLRVCTNECMSASTAVLRIDKIEKLFMIKSKIIEKVRIVTLSLHCLHEVGAD